MPVQRKCPNCNTWNNDEKYCTTCNTLLDPIQIEEEREKQREVIRQNSTSKFDEFLHKWEHSNYLFLRILYKILYTIFFIFFAIAGFFAWLAASPNG